jgi:hypothetical protein
MGNNNGDANDDALETETWSCDECSASGTCVTKEDAKLALDVHKKIVHSKG